MRKVQFAEHLDLVAAPGTEACRRPFAHTVHREKRRIGIRRREKCRGRVRFVMFWKNNFSCKALKFRLDERLHPDAFANPKWNRHEKTFQSVGRIRKIAVQDAIKFQKWLFVERDVIHVADFYATFAQTIFDRIFWKGRVVFFAGESFLLRGGDDPSVTHEARR